MLAALLSMLLGARVPVTDEDGGTMMDQQQADELRQKARETLDAFDFEKLQEVMVVMDWRWACDRNGADVHVVPDAQRLWETANRLVCSAVEESIALNGAEYSIESGGFRAYAWKDGITLKFTILDAGFERNEDGEWES